MDGSYEGLGREPRRSKLSAHGRPNSGYRNTYNIGMPHTQEKAISSIILNRNLSLSCFFFAQF